MLASPIHCPKVRYSLSESARNSPFQALALKVRPLRGGGGGRNGLIPERKARTRGYDWQEGRRWTFDLETYAKVGTRGWACCRKPRETDGGGDMARCKMR